MPCSTCTDEAKCDRLGVCQHSARAQIEAQVVYFHGGVPGLRPGCMILPPTITKVASSSEFGAAHVHRRDRVYIATKPEAALIFAVLHPTLRGEVYQVEPVGAIEPDHDWNGEAGVSMQVERARVLRVFRVPPAVRAAALKQLLPQEQS